MRRLSVIILLLPGALCASEAEAVRGALRKAEPPWYDPAADTWRRIEVPEPAAPLLSGSSLPGAQIIVALLLAGLLAAAAWVVWRLLALRRPTAAASADPAAPAATRRAPDLSLLPLPDAGLPPDEGLRRALAASDWRRAVVWVHAGLLARLDAAGALRLERGATERRLLDAARAWAADDPARRPVCDALASTGAAFAAVYFGHATADRALVDRLVAAAGLAERVLIAEGA